MQNIKETIQTICHILKAYGIEYIEPNHFRQAKHNEEVAVIIHTYQYLSKLEPMKRLTRDLLILDLMDFADIKITQIQIQQPDENNLILGLLCLRNCPLVINHEGEFYLNLSSSRQDHFHMIIIRDFLLIIGQILAEQDIFQKYSVVLQQRVEVILVILNYNFYAIKSKKNIKPKSKSKQKVRINPEFKGGSNDLDNLMIQKKIIQSRFREINVLIQRRELLESRIEVQIKQFGSIEQMLEIMDQQQTELILAQLNQSIKLLHQELFWQWMESIIVEDSKSIQNHPAYGFMDDGIQFTQNQKIIPLFKEQQVCQMLSILQRVIKQQQEINEKYKEFENISSVFVEEWARVSDLLYNNEECQQKLQQLEQVIPRIIQQQRKQCPPFELFLQQFNDRRNYIFCEQNEFIKLYIQQSRKHSSPMNQNGEAHQNEQLLSKLKDQSYLLKSEISTLCEKLNQALGDVITIIPK